MSKPLLFACTALIFVACSQSASQPIPVESPAADSVPAPATLATVPIEYLTVRSAPQPKRALFSTTNMPIDSADIPAFSNGLDKVMRFDQRLSSNPPYVQPRRTGRIIARDGCVLTEAWDSELHLTIMPSGITLGIDSEGYPAYLGASGDMIALLGTTVVYSGGGPRPGAQPEKESICGVSSSVYMPEIKSDAAD